MARYSKRDRGGRKRRILSEEEIENKLDLFAQIAKEKADHVLKKPEKQTDQTGEQGNEMEDDSPEADIGGQYSQATSLKGSTEPKDQLLDDAPEGTDPIESEESEHGPGKLTKTYTRRSEKKRGHKPNERSR